MSLLAEEGRYLWGFPGHFIRLGRRVLCRGAIVGGRRLLLVGIGIRVDVSVSGLRGILGWELEKLGEAVVVLLEKLESAESLDARCALGGVGELAGGKGMLANSDGGVSGLGGLGRRQRMVVRLEKPG